MHAFDNRQLADIARQYGTPLWVYRADTIRERIAELKAFDTIRYAQKANSNTHILRLMRAEGVKVDAVSLGEIERALVAGYRSGGEPSDIVFTADVLDRPTLAKVIAENIPVNAGSIDMLRQLGEAAPGHPVWLRINPGFGHGHSQKTNTGGENSKHGIWHGDLDEALQAVRRFNLRLIGIHMHIGSGVDYGHLEQVCGAMVELVARLECDIEAISAGGGLSIPYRDGDARIDTAHYFQLWDAARRRIEAHLGHPVQLEIEPGRFLVAEAGALLSEVRAVKNMGSRHFVLVDAGFNDLMRPSLYGSYHRISLLDADGAEKTGAVDTVVAGPLCESGDVFTQQEGGTVETRPLPPAQVGDLMVFHDAGAYGATMSSNYNSRPLLAEALVDGGAVRQIRRRQTIAELLALEA
ncbi:diaminopimelate decarboxylase [Chromobacterium violaceum]|uniref:diaminopimelate decarboxylase n=1 Tax=Chromobacterium violaceum TaxID=536 RepID=UPI0009DB13B4|nr:diaminopimelate decarboxylase [Chromobacterium violaceum]OQS50171.1 diaminopimelate decarboxylase [Chromobacterium violaceum]OQS52522.1 diaminopimelate decarboxylase [Chromobacterium violaceum]QRO32696.1 diaminopimelate decarboxylase [Chromobacterium violaceum]QRQ17503.1 diaminopimelate decarboxylase [Chromobacterium violaceum]